MSCYWLRNLQCKWSFKIYSKIQHELLCSSFTFLYLKKFLMTFMLTYEMIGSNIFRIIKSEPNYWINSKITYDRSNFLKVNLKVIEFDSKPPCEWLLWTKHYLDKHFMNSIHCLVHSIALIIELFYEDWSEDINLNWYKVDRRNRRRKEKEK